MKTSEQGRAFLTVLEGERLEAYRDSAGYWTIGVGHLLSKDKDDDYSGLIWTRQESQEALADDLEEAETAVQELVTVKLCQEEFDALVSWTFNLGRGALSNSTLLRLLNECARDSVPGQMNRWVYAGGEVQPGLVERRLAEGYLFSRRVYDMQPYRKGGVSG